LRRSFFQALLRRHHQRAMEWPRRRRETTGALGTLLRGRFSNGALDGGPACPGNHRLLRRIQISGRAHFGFGGAPCKRQSPTAGDKPIIAAIAPLASGDGFLHIGAALADQGHGRQKNFSAPVATSAEYSPRLWPATKSGVTPFFSRARAAPPRNK